MPLGYRSLKYISFVLLLSFLSGCAGRAAHLVMVRQQGDENRSCESITSELISIEGEIQNLIPKTNKTGKNVALGIAGWFLLVPWFFMDLSQAEQEEINAYRQRYNHLVSISVDKGCSGQRQQIPDFKDRMAFEKYQAEHGKPDTAVAADEMSLDEAKAKVDELEKKKAQQDQAQNFTTKK